VVVEATDYSPAILDYEPFQSGAVEFNGNADHDAASMIAPARTMVRQVAWITRQDRMRVAISIAPSIAGGQSPETTPHRPGLASFYQVI
jgi:hypothetical protein